MNEKEVKSLNLKLDEKKLLKPYINTNHIGRYEILFKNEYLLYLGKKERLDIANGLYPNIKIHLDSMSEFITSSNKPYGIHRTRNSRFFESPKIICKGMFLKPSFHYDEDKYYCGFSFSVIIQKSNKFSLKSLLGIMNSELAQYWFLVNGKKRGVGVDIGVQVFREFPIPKDIPKEKETELIYYVDSISELKKQLQSTLADSSKERLQNQINTIEFNINRLVYDLYDLSIEDREVIKSSLAK